MSDLNSMANVFGSATREQQERARVINETVRLEMQIQTIKKKMLNDKIAFYQAYTNNYQ